MNYLFKSLFLHLIFFGLIAAAILISHSSPVNQAQVSLNDNSISKSIPTLDKPSTGTKVALSAATTSSAQNDIQNNSENSPEEIQSYLTEITNRINQYKKYPESARLNEKEGVVELFLEISMQGRIVHLEISKPSPHESLNKAAMEAVQKIGVLTPLREPLKLHIPVHFQLL